MKKRTKKLLRVGTVRAEVPGLKWQKFFASFFQKRRFFLPSACLGFAVAIFAIEVSPMDSKVAIGAAAAFCAMAVWLILPRRARGLAILAVFVFGISLKLNKTLFLEELSQWQYVPFAGGAAGMTVGANDLAAILLLIGALRRRSAERAGVAWLIVSGPLLFIAAGVASLHDAGDQNLVWFELWRQALLLLSMLAAMNLSGDQLRTALRILALSIMVQGAIACIQVATGKDLGLGFLGEQALVEEQIDFAYQARAVGTIGHANILSYFFEITLPLMLALLMVSRHLWERVMYVVAIAAGLSGVLVTLSRAAWIAVPVTMLPVFLYFYGRRLLHLRSAVFGIGLLMLAAGALTVAWPTISERVFSDDAGSADARAPLNRAALSVIEQFPVLGVGLNNLGNAFPLFDQTHNSRVFGPINHVVHNLYLYVLAEVGIVGFLAFLWCFAGVLAVGWMLRRSPDPLARAIGVGGSAGLVAHMIHGLFDPGFRLSLAVSSLIAVQAGLIGAALLRHRRLPAAVPAVAAIHAVQDWRLRPRALSRVRAYR